ncbi:helix-turn-helix domain-containing protein [Rhodobacterales bacterium HKCCE2091]|nr:helix-turn-helix domain-containing protein [Rhodobacterales bacterium HKCCE2091]
MTGPDPRHDTHAARIDRTIRHIQGNLGGRLDLDTLAGIAAMSRFHFSRVFRARTGEGVADAVRRQRLNRAALLVAQTTDTMETIAARCGFGHVGSFERAFTAAWGTTPRRMRETGHLPQPLLAPEKGDFAMFPTDTREGEEMVIAAAPHRGAYQEIGAAFQTMYEALVAANMWKGSGPSVGIYYDDPSETPVEDLRSHAGQRIRAELEVPEGLDRLVLPGGRFLVVTSKGPFTRLPEAWSYLYSRALPESGLDFREGLPFEKYVTNSWDTKPEDAVTEIWMPVA